MGDGRLFGLAAFATEHLGTVNSVWTPFRDAVTAMESPLYGVPRHSGKDQGSLGDYSKLRFPERLHRDYVRASFSRGVTVLSCSSSLQFQVAVYKVARKRWASSNIAQMAHDTTAPACCDTSKRDPHDLPDFSSPDPQTQ